MNVEKLYEDAIVEHLINMGYSEFQAEIIADKMYNTKSTPL